MGFALGNAVVWAGIRPNQIEKQAYQLQIRGKNFFISRQGR